MAQRKTRTVGAKVPVLTHIELQRVAYEAGKSPSEYLYGLIELAIAGKIKDGAATQENEAKLKGEIEALKKELQKTKDKKPKVQTKTKTVTKEVVKPDPKVVKERDKAVADLKAAKADITKLNKSIKRLQDQSNKKDSSKMSAIMKIRELEDQIAKLKAELTDQKKALSNAKKEINYYKNLTAFAVNKIHKELLIGSYNMQKLIRDYNK